MIVLGGEEREVYFISRYFIDNKILKNLGLAKITLYEFLELPDSEQYDVIFIIGDFLELRFEKNKVFVLYAVNLFFVEVEYNEGNNKIINKRVFVQGKILDKYTFCTFN